MAAAQARNVSVDYLLEVVDDVFVCAVLLGPCGWTDAARGLRESVASRLVVRHVIIFGHGHGLQRAIIDESQHRTPERLIMAQH